MKKVLTLVVAALLVNLTHPAAPLNAASSAGAVAAGTVKVTVHYKGKGQVAASNKVWVWLFDTPNLGPTSVPIDQITLDTNGADAVFEGVVADTVWIAAAFDESGGMNGNGPPPPGTPIGILMGKDGAPVAVVPGAKDPVVLTFDDSQRMP